MNIERSRILNLASPAAPTGLENSGSKSPHSIIRSRFSRIFSYAPGTVLLLAAACGVGTEAKTTSSSVDTTPSPIATGEKILATQNPAVISTPEVKVAVPAVMATETVKDPATEIKSSLIRVTNEAGLIDPINSQKILNGDFKHPLFPNDSNAAKRIEYGAYSTEYDYLRTRYYAGDEKALDLAKQWREMIKSQFPEMYAQSESADPNAYEIVVRGK